MKRVLVIDGGGVKGFAPAAAMTMIEKRTGRKISEMFDLIVGTSVGAILGATASTGMYTMAQIFMQMQNIVPKMFAHRVLPSFPKYSRKPFIDFWGKTYGSPVMSDCRTKFLCTAVNVVDGKTHYFKSWETKDGRLPLLNPVLYSFAAPVYFGAIDANPSVWIDGGTGGENCPLEVAVIESLRQKWLGAGRIHILSLGTGSASGVVPYEEAREFKWLRQALYFMQPSEGGLARRQSIANAVEMAVEVSDIVNEYTFQRVDTTIPKKMDILDGVRYIHDYTTAGLTLAEGIDYGALGF